jgi:hypothetical protein
LAANLARAHSFADNPAHGDVVARLLEESAWFVEWAVPDAPLETQVMLVDCQRALARWRASWGRIWAEPRLRAEVAEQAAMWSQQLLGMSGLSQVSSPD